MPSSSEPGPAPRVILGVTGGVAAFKSVLLLRLLRKAGYDARVVLTPNATRFVGEPTYHALCGAPPYRDGWDLSRSDGGEQHVDLSAWADVLVVYPATYNFVGSVAAGLSDGLLELTFASFDGPRLVFPAMHHRMASQALHGRAVDALRDAGVVVADSNVGLLASGEVGLGRLPEPEEALCAIERALSPQDLAGRTVVVSAGPTREPVDPVRFLSNPSTGRMGFALAAVAARRGARVTLVAGPTSLETPADVRRVDVVTAADMAQAVLAAAGGADVTVMSAAVADFRPAEPRAHKVKKADALEHIALEATTDILGELARLGRGGLRVGFAMETQDLEANARAKLQRKDLAMIVANDLGEPGAGFSVSTNVVTLIHRDGVVERLPQMSKHAVAEQIWDRVAAKLGSAP